jgi:hypothetical protein
MGISRVGEPVISILKGIVFYSPESLPQIRNNLRLSFQIA